MKNILKQILKGFSNKKTEVETEHEVETEDFYNCKSSAGKKYIKKTTSMFFVLRDI